MGRLVVWFTNWLIGWLMGLLVGWLTDLLANLFYLLCLLLCSTDILILFTNIFILYSVLCIGQYLLERNFLACVTFPSHADIDADSNEQTYSKTRISKGTVFMKNSNALSSQMRFNDISITKKSEYSTTCVLSCVFFLCKKVCHVTCTTLNSEVLLWDM